MIHIGVMGIFQRELASIATVLATSILNTQSGKYVKRVPGLEKFIGNPPHSVIKQQLSTGAAPNKALNLMPPVYTRIQTVTLDTSLFTPPVFALRRDKLA